MGANFSEHVAFLNEKVGPDGWFLTNSVVLAGLTNFGGSTTGNRPPITFAPYAAGRINSNLKASSKQFGWLQAPATNAIIGLLAIGHLNRLSKAVQ